MALRKILLNSEELDSLKEKIFNYGGESILVKSPDNDIVYKIYRDYISPNERESKHRKLELVAERQIEHITKPKCVLICDGKIVGHGFEYDKDNVPMLLYPFNHITIINYLRRIKKILLYLEENNIVVADLKSDNILINLETGEIKFCDIDSFQIDDIPTTNIEDYLKGFLKGELLDKGVHIFLYNLMTIDQVFTGTSDFYEDAMEKIDLERLKECVDSESLEIVRRLVKDKTNYQDLYLIDGLNPQNIVKYKKR